MVHEEYRNRVFVLLGVLCFVFLFTSKSYAEELVDVVDKLYEKTNKIISKGKVEKNRYYTDFEGYKDDVWYEVAGAKEIKAFEEAFIKAEVVSVRGKVLKASIFITPVTGDWENLRVYIFNDDDETILIHEVHEISRVYNYDEDKPLDEGPYVIESKTYYNPNDSMVEGVINMYSTSAGYHKDTKKSVPYDYLDHFYLSYLKIYQSVEELPF